MKKERSVYTPAVPEARAGVTVPPTASTPSPAPTPTLTRAEWQATREQEAGREILSELWRLLDRSQKESFRSVFPAYPSGWSRAIGKRVMLRCDFEHAMASLQAQRKEVAAYYEKVKGWFGENKRELEEGRKAIATLAWIRGEGVAEESSKKPEWLH